MKFSNSITGDTADVPVDASTPDWCDAMMAVAEAPKHGADGWRFVLSHSEFDALRAQAWTKAEFSASPAVGPYEIGGYRLEISR